LIAYVKAENIQIEWILETHIHADHITSCDYLKKQFNARSGIGVGIKEVLAFWVPIFDTKEDTREDGLQFDKLFHDGEELKLGEMTIRILHTPGHTPACVSYLIDNRFVFVGDTLFMPDIGTARTDFPGGSAEQLYDSIQRIFALGEDVQVFVGHDYPPTTRAAACHTTVREQKLKNILIHEHVSQEDYILMRKERDRGKSVPKMLLPAIQINLRAGSYGNPHKNNTCYVKIPLNRL
jgi:glyoxylase-like metal-dependent hydrolase (beta-lactamase superfamily II)